MCAANPFTLTALCGSEGHRGSSLSPSGSSRGQWRSSDALAQIQGWSLLDASSEWPPRLSLASSLGYGLRCHRAIITICRLIGIKDMYAKVSGSVNMINLTCGVFRGLSRQVTALGCGTGPLVRVSGPRVQGTREILLGCLGMVSQSLQSGC